VQARGPDGVGLNYTTRQAAQVEAVLRPLVESGEVESLFMVIGRGDPNNARAIAPLAPWGARPRSQQEIAAALQDPLAAIPGARVTVESSNSLGIGGAGGGLQIALTGNEYPEIHAAALELSAAIEQRLTALSQPQISYQPTQPQLSFQIDRRRAT